MHLLIVDTAGIQPYIFGSNRLRENIGASHLVAQATEGWALSLVPPPHNVIDAQTGKLNDARIERDGLAAEVIYAGGGNFVALFHDDVGAKEFTRKLSRKALEDAPNLQLVIAQQPFDWDSESLYDKVQDTFIKLTEEKRARALSSPLLGLGVTVMCQSTGLPAIGMAPEIGDDPQRPASAEIMTKLRVVERKGKSLSEADQRLRELLPLRDGYDYPAQLDHLGGTKGEHNFIAVVHADGDGMGQRIMDIGKVYPSPSQNRDYINALRSFSEAVSTAAQAALCETLNKLVAKIQDNKGKKVIVHANASGNELVRVELSHKDGEWLLPFRPIVLGGDDVTFVSDGRLGLSLAIEYIRQLEDHTKGLPDKRGRLTASAGVAIVKAHYPFARAYALADDLCRSAKSYRRELVESGPDWNGSCLDWHFALSGLSGEIGEIRAREYEVNAGFLTLRPVTLEENAKAIHRTWGAVQKGLEAFQDLPPATNPGEKLKWSTRRNKVKALRDTLRGGEVAVERFLKMFDVKLPDLGLGDDCQKKGWYGDRCPYFDAIEMMDWFIPL
jgi:hypothetical protein